MYPEKAEVTGCIVGLLNKKQVLVQFGVMTSHYLANLFVSLNGKKHIVKQ